jgi:divalent metal cation (Fe/Co/Zn/Cd) transporter
MATILSLISGGNGLLVALGAVLAAIVAAFFKGRSVERTNQKARNADALQNHYNDVAAAADARSRVDADGMRDNAPYKRD